jgi:hypothetical protein
MRCRPYSEASDDDCTWSHLTIFCMSVSVLGYPGRLALSCLLTSLMPLVAQPQNISYGELCARRTNKRLICLRSSVAAAVKFIVPKKNRNGGVALKEWCRILPGAAPGPYLCRKVVVYSACTYEENDLGL